MSICGARNPQMRIVCNTFVEDAMMLPLMDACSNGHVHIVKYLCELHLYDNNYKKIDINYYSSKWAFMNGHLMVFKYLCELHKHIKTYDKIYIHSIPEGDFRQAVKNKNYKTIRYIFTLYRKEYIPLSNLLYYKYGLYKKIDFLI